MCGDGKGKCACSYSLYARVQGAQSDNEADSVSDMSACKACDDCQARGRRGTTSLLGRTRKGTLPTIGNSRSLIGPGADALRRGWIGYAMEAPIGYGSVVSASRPHLSAIGRSLGRKVISDFGRRVSNPVS